ncbi:MAG: hypothetical protein QG658_194 [Patescibacteria group bacterium]|nr:hypothetical protein [Patescibacteria group bacterium]
MIKKSQLTIKKIMRDLRRYEAQSGMNHDATMIRSVRSYHSERPIGFQSRSSHSYFVR